MNIPVPYREVEHHKINPVNDTLTIEVMDKPGAGGACHNYVVSLPPKPDNDAARVYYSIIFQNGPIAEHGVNGLTHEVLLAILIDRLQSFQKGQFACRENALALTKLEEAMLWLAKRTLDRMRRGVEGTSQK